MLDSNIDLTIDIKKLNAKGMARISSFLIKNNKEKIISIKKLKTPISLDFKNNTLIKVEKLKTKAPVLKEFKEKRITASQLSGDNILIEGDNFHALSILNYTHSKKIDMIYNLLICRVF